MSARNLGTPSIGRLSRDRGRRLAIGLAVVLAIPIATLFYFQFRSLSDLGKSSTVLLTQLSRETADGASNALQDALGSPRTDVLLKIAQRQTEPLDLPHIKHTFEEGFGLDPFVDAFYVWSDATVEHHGDVLSLDRTTHSFVVNPPEADAIVRQFKALASEKRAIAAFEMPQNGRRMYFTAQLRFTFPSRDRMTSFVALSVDAERLRKEFVPTLVASKFAHVDGPSGFPLEITVLDGDNRVVYPAGGMAPKRFVDERTFPLVFYAPDLAQFAAPEGKRFELWRVRTGFGGQTIPEVVAARARPQYAMMMLLASVMTLSVLFVAHAAAREVRAARSVELANLRTRIALDLHDDIGLNLTKISILGEVARQQRPITTAVDESLSTIARISRDSAAAMSDIVWAINPQRDRLFDLVQRMRRHAEETCISQGVALSFLEPSDDRTIQLSMDARRDLFLMFKESINNIARHSRCARVEISVMMKGASISLQISDDGVGFDPSQRIDGEGLANMKRRAERYLGACEVHSAPGRGTTVSMVLPLAKVA